ncbi:NADP-dependent oxidoreductase [Achromobacter insolitus]|uniref:NADP-dependent oxidoreductase n=1 Tax=Achromobacter insolitus TaxID=217204 RepID=UPI0026592F77|nr:NADP-dependent oxidoreductase [Achromobacter insolitus]WKK18748.1 NADP-dependent oxidoreductase [Achromobacter insolitus]
MPVNRQVVLTSRPHGIPQAEHFAIRDSALPALQPGELLVRNLYLSVDPAMRGWVNAAANYSDPVALGEVMRSFAVGRVVESRHPDYAAGMHVMGMLGWQDYAITDGSPIRRIVRETDLPLSLSLGVLGLNGITAHFALSTLGRPQPGETLVVSTAAGAVGSIVGQLGRLAGCRVVGIAGGEEKRRICLDEFGFDAAIDYRAGDLAQALTQSCPDGVDVYFDNTAGRISDAVLPRINRHARIVVCGTAAIASWDPWPEGPRVERHLLNKAAQMSGFLVWDYEHRYEEAVARLAPLVRSGALRYREEIQEGLESAPGAIADLYAGRNLGKRLIRLTSNDE